MLPFAKPPKSISLSLTFWYAFSLALILGSVTIFLYQSLKGNFHRENRLLIQDRMHTVISFLQGEPKVDALKARIESEWSLHRFEKIYVRVSDANGRILVQTPNVPQDVVALAFAPLALVNAGNPIRLDANSAPLLLLTRNFLDPERGAKWQVFVALDLSSERDLLWGLQKRILSTLLLAIFLSLFVGRLIAKRGLAPLESMTLFLNGLNPADLSARIAADLPEELEILGKTFNGLLGKIQHSLNRISEFSSDIAHELRNPLNNLSGQIEVALGRGRDREDYVEVLGSCLEECQRLKSLVDSLLFLARAESGGGAIKMEVLELSAELQNIVDFYEASAMESGVQMKLTVADGLQLLTNRSLLQAAVGNLLRNSFRHTMAGGLITIAAKETNAEGKAGAMMLEVTDTGCGIAPEHLERVFDRLYRVDSQRSATDEAHFGLGLSIVQAIVKQHNGRVEISSILGRGTKVTLYL